MIELNSLKADRIPEIDKFVSDLTLYEYKVYIKFKKYNVTCVDFNKKTRTLRISHRYYLNNADIFPCDEIFHAFSTKINTRLKTNSKMNYEFII